MLKYKRMDDIIIFYIIMKLYNNYVIFTSDHLFFLKNKYYYETHIFN